LVAPARVRGQLTGRHPIRIWMTADPNGEPHRPGRAGRERMPAGIGGATMARAIPVAVLVAVLLQPVGLCAATHAAGQAVRTLRSASVLTDQDALVRACRKYTEVLVRRSDGSVARVGGFQTYDRDGNPMAVWTVEQFCVATKMLPSRLDECAGKLPPATSVASGASTYRCKEAGTDRLLLTPQDRVELLGADPLDAASEKNAENARKDHQAAHRFGMLFGALCGSLILTGLIQRRLGKTVLRGLMVGVVCAVLEIIVALMCMFVRQNGDDAELTVVFLWVLCTAFWTIAWMIYVAVKAQKQPT
jgi:hypothetical protein